VRRRSLFALAGAAAGVTAGVVAEHSILRRRRRTDPEGGRDFGRRRGERRRELELSDGARLFIEETGPTSRRGAVFVHGSALRTDAWYYQLEGIRGHRLVFYDLRGHGLSLRGEADFSVATLGRDLAAVIEDSDLEEVVVVGHSVGGMAAMQLCMERPEWTGTRLKGLVLVNTTYCPAVETLAGGATAVRLERLTRRPFDALGSQSRRLERLRRIIKPSDALFWGVSFAAFGPHSSAKQIDFTYDMLAETPMEVIFDLIRSYRDFDLRDRLDEIAVPALLVAGDRDRLTTLKASEYMAEHLPKAHLEILEGCGHMAMLERYREFNDLVGGFLDDTLGTSGRRRTKRKMRS
jgi:pimeloyl-ACP methyl ester carboxylesterase